MAQVQAFSDYDDDEFGEDMDDDLPVDEEERSSLDTVKLAMPVMLLLATFAFPPETSLPVGPLRMSPYRFVLLFTMIQNLSALFSGRLGPIILADWAILLHSVWAVIALINYGGLDAVQTGGIYFIECAGSYLLARRYIRSAADFAAMAKFMTFFICGMLLFTIPESATHQHFIRETFRAVLGGPSLPVIDPRMGLSRAFGSFEHPILYGTYCASGFGMALYVVTRSYARFKGTLFVMGVGFACFLSLSAGSWIAAVIQLLLGIWDRITRGIPLRWGILFLLFVLAIMLVSTFSSRSPVNVFISYASFSAQSSYNRINIWEYGTAEVGRHWWLGIGLGDWIRAPWMSASMDNFWLVTAVRYGMPAFLLLALTIFSLAISAAAQRNREPEWVACRSAWIMTLFGIGFSATTVHLWNALFCEFLFLIGCGAFLASPQVEQKPQIAGNAREDEFYDEDDEDYDDDEDEDYRRAA